MRAIQILTVCGTGTVGAAALAVRLKGILDKKGYAAQVTEASPENIKDNISLEDYDVVVYITPIDKEASIPMLNGTGLLLGINEDEFIEKFMEVVGKLELYED
ncbi:PTS sugar transporter subunit IIB [Anaerocolumna xylanovorans]|uniref:PTS system, galactitol-specific IIB component n=1 Tax=Anaerocolumna xylanovorans DSM 12503 TaxID=1121345 RepID=A0A1M7YDB1_9FIRM|nr:hypothetical protein [Anaerocolumna xylanovorans]SHO50624.1 PTS system, galactitol-specific IIB component [Anaerocolumna xylanovorans DSM 12503]